MFNIFFATVYLPYQCAENFDSYIECLGMLTAIRNDVDYEYFCIIGDLNAEPNRGQFGIELSNFCSENNLNLLG